MHLLPSCHSCFNSHFHCLASQLFDEVEDPTLQVEQVKVPLGPMTHAQVKNVKELLQALVRAIQDQVGVPRAIEGMEEARFINVLVNESEEKSN